MVRGYRCGRKAIKFGETQRGERKDERRTVSVEEYSGDKTIVFVRRARTLTLNTGKEWAAPEGKGE